MPGVRIGDACLRRAIGLRPGMEGSHPADLVSASSARWTRQRSLMLGRLVCLIACGDTVTDAHLSNSEIMVRAADWLPPLTAGERS